MMKKNITINMCGRLFAIDEDAYHLVKQYVDTLRSHFARRGEAEVADDIEERIAELFDELKSGGRVAVTIEDVEAVINRVGRPEQLMSGSEETGGDDGVGGAPDAEIPAPAADGGRGWRRLHRLYRDTRDSVVAGVVAGLAHYFGINPQLLRRLLLAVPLVLALVYGLVALKVLVPMGIAYTVCVILIPRADTPEKLVEMRGEEVTPQNIAKELTRKESGRRVHAGIGQRMADGMVRFFGVCVKSLSLLLVVVLATMFVVVLLVVLAAFLLPGLGLFEVLGMEQVAAHFPILVYMLCCCLLVSLFIPAYAIVHALLSGRGKGEKMGLMQRIAWAVAWLVAFAGVFAVGDKAASVQNELYERQYRKANMHGGVFVSEEDWAFMQAGRWKLLKHDHCNDRYTWVGSSYDDKEMRYLDVYDTECRQVFQAERTDTVENGLYRLTAVVKAEGEGGCIYALTPKKHLVPIPACGSEGGKVWEEAMATDSASVVARANGGKGYGWSRVVIDSIWASHGVVKYGVTTDSKFTGRPYRSRFVSAADFRLERIR